MVFHMEFHTGICLFGTGFYGVFPDTPHLKKSSPRKTTSTVLQTNEGHSQQNSGRTLHKSHLHTCVGIARTLLIWHEPTWLRSLEPIWLKANRIWNILRKYAGTLLSAKPACYRGISGADVPPVPYEKGPSDPNTFRVISQMSWRPCFCFFFYKKL